MAAQERQPQPEFIVSPQGGHHTARRGDLQLLQAGEVAQDVNQAEHHAPMATNAVVQLAAAVFPFLLHGLQPMTLLLEAFPVPPGMGGMTAQSFLLRRHPPGLVLHLCRQVVAGGAQVMALGHGGHGQSQSLTTAIPMAALTRFAQRGHCHGGHRQATELPVEGHHVPTGEQQPDIPLRQAEQQGELARARTFVHQDGGGGRGGQMGRLDGDDGALAGKLQGKGQFVGHGFLRLLPQGAQETVLFPQLGPLLFVAVQVLPGDGGQVLTHGLHLGGQLVDGPLLIHQAQAGQIPPKAALHQRLGLAEGIALQQVEHHAVAGGELAHQGIGRAGGQLPRFPHPFKAALDRHHMAPLVQAPAPCPPRHLEKLAGHQGAMARFRALGQGGDDRAAGRHVDAGSQGFRGQHHLEQAPLEQLLNQLLPGGQDPRMVGGNAPQQGIGMAVTPHPVGHLLSELLQPLRQALLLIGVEQVHPGQFPHPPVAPPPAEDEHNGGQHVPLRQLLHHETEGRRLRLGRPGGASAATVALGGAPHLATGVQTVPRPVEERVQPLGAAKAMAEGHRPMDAVDQGARTMNLLDPVRQLIPVGHGGGEGQKLHGPWTVDDGLLPDGAPLAVVHVVALIQHHRLHPRQRIVQLALAVEHVAENLRGHHHHRRLPIDGQVPREQPHPLGTERSAKIPQLLVGQGLEGGGVKYPPSMGQRPVDGVFPDQRFTGPRRGAHHQGLALVDGSQGVLLKSIQGKGK